MIRTCFYHQEIANAQAELLAKQFPDCPPPNVFNTVECDFCDIHSQVTDTRDEVNYPSWTERDNYENGFE